MAMMILMMIIIIVITIAIMMKMIKIIPVIAVVIIIDSPFQPGDSSTGSTTAIDLLFTAMLLTIFYECFYLEYNIFCRFVGSQISTFVSITKSKPL